jgi:DNA-binding GntR family transcriptional regulator
MSTLKEMAYQRIRERLLAGDYPPGMRLGERQCAREMKISQIPVREAIGKLASEGILKHTPGVGAFVPTATPHELEELYDLRQAIECHAVYKLAGKMLAEDLQQAAQFNDQLEELARQMKTQGLDNCPETAVHRWMLADMGFHLSLIRATGNSRAVKVFHDLHIMSRILGEYRKDRPLSRLELACKDHKQILAYLQSGEAEKVRELMHAHVQHGLDLAVEHAKRRQSREISDSATSGLMNELVDQLQEIEYEVLKPVGKRTKGTKKKRSDA